jgi:hypothetical protein
MSVDICVFLRESDLPSRDQWLRAIHDAGHDFEFDDFSPTEHVGFVPCRMGGKECGFEYSFDAIDHEEDEDIRAIVGERTHVVTFTLHGSLLDLGAAELAASVLTDLANGVFFDPQSGSHAIGKAVYRQLAEERNAEHQRKLEEAERKWAKVTERRCPKCNARCPEYRGSCWVCGYTIGKV